MRAAMDIPSTKLGSLKQPPVKKRKLVSNPELVSPVIFVSKKLKGVPPRIDPLSVEHALYFEPYQESHIPEDVVVAAKEGNLARLQQFPTQHLHSRNVNGENLLHLVCQQGMDYPVAQYLIKHAQLSPNVRDRCGRTPLHNACSAAKPNFDVIRLILERSPKLLVVFEDDKGMVPLDYVQERDFSSWNDFLSEHFDQLQASLENMPSAKWHAAACMDNLHSNRLLSC